MTPGDDDQKRLSGRDASAGKKLGVMRYVLGISLALAVLLMFVIIMRPFG